MKKAVYAGTFDMPTKGHESVIDYAAGMVDELVVSIGINPVKHTMFSLDDRILMLKDIAEKHDNVKVGSFSVDEYLVNYAESIGAQFIVRGLRNITDFMNEQVMCEKNFIINPNVKTIFVITDHKYSNVASSTVKMMMGPFGWVDAVRDDIPDVMWPRFLRLVKEYSIVPVR